jgi:hypothetical protein
MNNIEQRLKFAMVAYIGGNRPAVSCSQVLEALATANIPAGEVSVHEFVPEDFLVVFAKAEHRNRVAALPSITHAGFSLFFRNWNRQAQAEHVTLGTRVELVIEGIPPHAWETEIVEDLLGKSCVVEEIAVETATRRDLASLELSTSDLPLIPVARTLVVPEPAMETVPATSIVSSEQMRDHGVRKEPNLPALQYKVLIHVAKVDELVHVADAEIQAATPGAGNGGGACGGGGRRWISRVQPWQRGKVDRRGGHVPRAHQEGGQRHVTPNLSSWQLPLLRRPEPLVIQTSRADSESDPDDLGAGNTTTNPVVAPPLEKEKVVVPRDKAGVASEPLGSTAEDASERELVVVLSTEETGNSHS